MNKKILIPDSNSWLVENSINFFKLLKNEFRLSLWDALNEFVEHFQYECAYLGLNDTNNLNLYPQFEYKPETKTAVLKKLFFVSPKIQFILTHDYLQKNSKNNFLNTTKQKFNLSKNYFPYEEKMPGAAFLSEYNKMNLEEAKELLLQGSYQRQSLQHLVMIENQNANFEYDVINETIILIDLTFLKDCSFLKVSRYKSFQNLLNPNLIIELPYKLKINVKKIPQQLKNEQLINLSYLKR